MNKNPYGISDEDIQNHITQLLVEMAHELEDAKATWEKAQRDIKIKYERLIADLKAEEAKSGWSDLKTTGNQI